MNQVIEGFAFEIVNRDRTFYCQHLNGDKILLTWDDALPDGDLVCPDCGIHWIALPADLQKKMIEVVDPYALENVLNNDSSLYRLLYEIYESGEVAIKQCKFCGDVFATSFDSEHCNTQECFDLQVEEDMAMLQIKNDQHAREADERRQVLQKEQEVIIPIVPIVPVYREPKKQPEKRESKEILDPKPDERIYKYTPKVSTKRQGDYEGYVYLVTGENGLCKIGMSGNVEKRFTGIQAQSPVPVTLKHYFFVDNCRLFERALHQRFSNQRSHFEWFNLTDEQIKWFCTLTDGESIPTAHV